MNTNCLPLSLILNSCTTSTLQKVEEGEKKLAVKSNLGPWQTRSGQARVYGYPHEPFDTSRQTQGEQIQAEGPVRLVPQLPKVQTKCKT